MQICHLVGAYYAPARIIADPGVLETLPPWRLRDGFAECIKHAIAQDRTYLSMLLDPAADVMDLDFVAMCVERNIQLKCELMAVDPAERDEGMVLQYGHTMGHAVEHATQHALGHGESVAIGMCFAARVSAHLGFADADLIALHERVLTRHGLPTAVPLGLDTDTLLSIVRRGKRYVDRRAYMALLGAPGALHRDARGAAIPVSDDVLATVLRSARASDASPPVRQSSAPPVTFTNVVPLRSVSA